MDISSSVIQDDNDDVVIGMDPNHHHYNDNDDNDDQHEDIYERENYLTSTIPIVAAAAANAAAVTTTTTTTTTNSRTSSSGRRSRNSSTSRARRTTTMKSAIVTSPLQQQQHHQQQFQYQEQQQQQQYNPTATTTHYQEPNNNNNNNNATFDPHSIVSNTNGLNWYTNDGTNTMVLNDINGSMPLKSWGMRTPASIASGNDDDILREGSNSDKRLTRLDIFLLLFPPQQLYDMVRYTNEQLVIKIKRTTTKCEMLQFLGIIVLMTKYEYKSRASLWCNTAPSKYEVAPCFGKTGMSRKRFDEIWMCLRFSYQPITRPNEMSVEQYRWLLVDGFVKNYNDHRATMFIPSDTICIDESTSRWYGKERSEWKNYALNSINHSTLTTSQIRPENGCKIQNAACTKSGILLQLQIVKNKTIGEVPVKDNDNNDNEDNNDDYDNETNNEMDEDLQLVKRNTKQIKTLLLPWKYSERIVVAKSYYTSVDVAEELRRCGLRFIGMISNPHVPKPSYLLYKYPIDYLGSATLHEPGDRRAIVAPILNDKNIIAAFVWSSHTDRKYFITTGSTLNEGTPYTGTSANDVAANFIEISPNSNNPNNPTSTTTNTTTTTTTKKEPSPSDQLPVSTPIPQPKVVELYHTTSTVIDQHNRDRADSLGIDIKIRTHDWSTRINLSLFSMCLVDCWRAYNQLTFTSSSNKTEVQKEFYGHLAAELIDNTYEIVPTRGGGGGGTRASSASRQIKQDDDNDDDDDDDSDNGKGRRNKLPSIPSSRLTRSQQSKNAADNTMNGKYITHYNKTTKTARCILTAYLIPTPKKRVKRDGKQTNHCMQGRCRVCGNKTTFCCSLCQAIKDENNGTGDEGWVCMTKPGSMKNCFDEHIQTTHASM